MLKTTADAPRINQLKFLHIIATVDPRSGGPIEGVLKTSEILQKLGHIRNVATLDSPEDPWIKDCPIPVYPLGVLTERQRKRWRWLPWVRYGYTPLLVPWLKARAQEYDFVIVNGLWNYCAFAARRALKGSEVPYFVFTHGMLDPWFRRTYPLKTLFKQLFWWFSEGPLLANARGVLFTAEEERILARNAFWPYAIKEYVVGYGTTDVQGDPVQQIRAFHANFPNLGRRRFLLYLSRIHPKKGCDLLIQAFARLADREPDLDLVMAGPDQVGWAAKLKRQAAALGIAERVHWPGMLSGSAKWGAFRACEAFVLPSHQENFGIVVAEAMACEKPVLITNKVNIWREVEKGAGGFVVNDDLAGIEMLLERFFSQSADNKRKMGSAARSIFLKEFLVENNVMTFLNIVGKYGRAHDNSGRKSIEPP